MANQKMKYARHPLSLVWGNMPGPEFLKLKKDIKKNGVLFPITVIEEEQPAGKETLVLDGWHRYRACCELGIDCPEDGWSPEDSSPASLVLSANLHRRNLTPSQRAAAVVACRKWKKPGRPVQTPPSPGTQEPPESGASIAEMASEAQVSKRTISDAKAAQEAGMGQEVLSGQRSASEAAASTPGRKKAKKKKAAKKRAAIGASGAVNIEKSLEKALKERNDYKEKLDFMEKEGSPVSATRQKTFDTQRTLIKSLKADLATVKKKYNAAEAENKDLRKAVKSGAQLQKKINSGHAQISNLKREVADMKTENRSLKKQLAQGEDEPPF